MKFSTLKKTGLGVTAAGIALATLIVGCGSPKTAKLSGKVLFQGRPLPGGLVTLFPMEGQGNPASAIIGEDGRYTIENAPVGTVKITVTNMSLKKGDVAPIGMSAGPNRFTMAPRDAMAKALEGKEIPPYKGSQIVGTYVPIPASYSNVKTTGLGYTVEGKSQEYNIELR
jgi:hypothetical protein